MQRFSAQVIFREMLNKLHTSAVPDQRCEERALIEMHRVRAP